MDSLPIYSPHFVQSLRVGGLVPTISRLLCSQRASYQEGLKLVSAFFWNHLENYEFVMAAKKIFVVAIIIFHYGDYIMVESMPHYNICVSCHKIILLIKLTLIPVRT